jgi:hypothetical protein
VDTAGFVFEPGDLQARGLRLATAMFTHRYFVDYLFKANKALWVESEMRVFQIQIPLAEGGVRVFGTIVTDGDQNLVRWCVEDCHRHRRSNRETMRRSVDQLCTRESNRNYKPA